MIALQHICTTCSLELAARLSEHLIQGGPHEENPSCGQSHYVLPFYAKILDRPCMFFDSSSHKSKNAKYFRSSPLPFMVSTHVLFLSCWGLENPQLRWIRFQAIRPQTKYSETLLQKDPDCPNVVWRRAWKAFKMVFHLSLEIFKNDANRLNNVKSQLSINHGCVAAPGGGATSYTNPQQSGGG